MELTSIWFALVFVLFAGFAVLDAFDLGVGSLQFLWRTDAERRRAVNTIRPAWDGHELWLVAAVAALFVAFPPAYGLVVSAFGILLAVVAIAFLARAVAIESCATSTSSDVQRQVRWGLVVTSVLPPLLLGTALGNVMRGLPIDTAGQYQGTFLSLFNPYALLIGVLTVVLFALHGALYLEGRTEGSMRARLQKWIVPLWSAFAVLHLLAAAATAWWSAHLYDGITARPLFWVLTILWLAAFLFVPVLVSMKKYTLATVGSAVTIAAMVGLVGVSLFPQLVPSTGSGMSMTIENSGVAPDALRTMLVIGLMVLALIIGGTAYAYRGSRRNAVLATDPC